MHEVRLAVSGLVLEVNVQHVGVLAVGDEALGSASNELLDKHGALLIGETHQAHIHGIPVSVLTPAACLPAFCWMVWRTVARDDFSAIKAKVLIGSRHDGLELRPYATLLFRVVKPQAARIALSTEGDWLPPQRLVDRRARHLAGIEPIPCVEASARVRVGQGGELLAQAESEGLLGDTAGTVGLKPPPVEQLAGHLLLKLRCELLATGKTQLRLQTFEGLVEEAILANSRGGDASVTDVLLLPKDIIHTVLREVPLIVDVPIDGIVVPLALALPDKVQQ